MGQRHLPDEHTLLCETCGYDIESLPKDVACPECGTPIRDSLPEARTGTPWQQRPSLHSLLTTWRLVLTRPAKTFAAMTPERPTALDVLTWTAAASLLGVMASIHGTREILRDKEGLLSLLGPLLFGFVAASLVVWVIALLTWIEERGIRFWGPKRGWRITPAIAKVICAHASVGWLLGSLLSIPAHLLGLALMDWTNHNNAGIFRGPMQLAPITLPALALIAGMLTFEVLVYIGMTRMKFANRARNTPRLDPPPPRAGEVSAEAPRG